MRILLCLLLAVAPALVAADHDHGSPSPAAAKAGPVYQCPMHPWIKSASPGKCTLCGMDLVAASSSDATPREGTVVLASSSVSAIGVRTDLVARQSLTRTVRVAGRIEDDDTRHRILSARVPGRVEQLFINFVGAPIEAGSPLATLWSPEILTAERVYVERLKGGDIAFSASDRAAAREQLQQLGLVEADIAQLEQTRTPTATVTVRSPMAGTVVSKSVYEGQYVQPSDRLFEVADFSRMWFVFDAYAQDIPWLHVGQTVEVTTRAVPGEVISSTIEFIDPNFDEQRQTTRVRAILPNPHYSVGGEAHNLPHRVLAEGRVLVETPAVLAAPRSAILDTGAGPVAYVATDDRTFSQRTLQLGRRGDALVEILSGLAEGERVVTEGNLLIDAQAQLAREAAGHTPAADATSDGGRAPPSTSAPSASASSPKSDLPAKKSATADFSALVNAAIDAADALGSDDFARYARHFPQLTAAAQGFALPPLQLGNSLKSARTSFEPWSTAVADLVAAQRAALGVKIFQCPMSPVLTKGRWIQRSLPLKNPFFGSAMPNCGEELR